MGSGTCSWQLFYSMSDNQCKVSRSHLSFVWVQLGSHKVRNLVRCDIFIVALGSAGWLPHFLEESDSILAHWVKELRKSYRSNVWLDSARVPLWVKRICPYTLPRPYPLSYVVLRYPSSGSLGSIFWILVVVTIALGYASILCFPLSFSFSGFGSNLGHAYNTK